MVDSHEQELDHQPHTVLVQDSKHTESLEDKGTSPSKASPIVIDNLREPMIITKGLETLDITASQEETRARIAWLFTTVFLSMIGAAFALPAVTNIIAPRTFVNPLETTKELVTLLASILAGPFGFIVGFYFKKVDE